jgi:hypothetical protein
MDTHLSVQLVGYWNTDSGKENTMKVITLQVLWNWKAKKMWTPIKKGEKTLEASTLFNHLLKMVGPDQKNQWWRWNC